MKKLVGLIFLLSSILCFANSVLAPDFQLQDQFSKTHSLTKYKGKRIFLVFWASWCNYCQSELETINEMYKTTGKNSEDVIFLTFNNEEKEQLEKYIDEKKYDFPVINDKEIFYQYYIEGYPTTYILDRDGKVIKSIEGRMKEEEIKSFIDMK